MNQLLVGGVALDLDASTRILPSFQASDLLKPDTIQSDFSPELSVPATQRNEAILGHASVDGSGARVPYRVLPDVTLLSDGVDIMPRARLYLKGYSEGRYQLQLFAGNRRFVEALGEKTLRDLDFSRYTHLWTLGNVAQRATAAFREANGWGYELYDRGKPVNLASVSPFELYPTVSADLIWQQMLEEAGFTASDWGSELLDKLQVPAAELAVLSEAYRTARRLRVTTGNNFPDEGAPSQDRNDVVKVIPFDKITGTIGTVPIIAPTAPGVYDPISFAFIADRAMYVDVEARTALRIIYSTVRLGRAKAEVQLHVNGQRVLTGQSYTAPNEDAFSVGVAAGRLLLKAGDRLTAVLRMSGVGSGGLGDKWGYEVFQYTIYRNNGVSVPEDKFEVTVLEELAPGGEVSLNDFLPEIKQLDFFKTLCQLGGLSVNTDPYEDHIYLWPSAEKLGNAHLAKDWTRLRDEPPGPRGTARKVEFKWGSFGQRNAFKWAEDESVTTGYGNGYFLIDNAQLPAAYTMLTLPFAATEMSTQIPGLLSIPGWKVRENEDGFADIEYDRIAPKPRLTLASGSTIALTLIEGSQTRAVAVPTSYFASSATDMPSLDAETYVLPQNWQGLQAVLSDCRVLTERYRLDVTDIAAFVEKPDTLIWDSILGGYYWVTEIAEFSTERPTEVTMLRVDPAYIGPIATGRPGEFAGPEFASDEFFTGNVAR